MSPELRQELRSATANLLYPSDTDAPFEIVDLPPPFPWASEWEAFNCGASKPAFKRQPVQILTPRQFFEELRAGPPDDAAGFHALYGLLTGRLADLAIHRIGTLQIDIFITGFERDQLTKNRVGLKTTAVES